MAEPTETPEALRAVRGFIAAANRGDVPALHAALAPQVRIDMAGAVHTGRDEVLRAFFVRWVVRPGGRYREVAAGPVRPAGGGAALTVRYDFRTPQGLVEDITYTYLVRGGEIAAITGRFV
ncbi:hypothetical protein KNE206_78030 [Kitasatospora sp. NE20-6]|uniref:nuclear transport factor 2 family protein n=1 Tax=Kitasatospora sp. NE20-6 TaxID=2859066 RepID=UPI0034DC81E8